MGLEIFNDVIDYWFEKDESGKTLIKNRDLWWQKSDEIDRAIEIRFGALLYLEVQGEFDQYCDSKSLLSRIILLDQFSRNIYRGEPEAFENDSKGRKLAQQIVDEKKDLELDLIQRVFAYLPFEHSEKLEDQELSLELFSNLEKESPEQHQKLFQNFYQFAVAHHKIIKQFGRFPHRNQLLGRESTPEEIEFLKQEGSSF